jgi:hypothetical protein
MEEGVCFLTGGKIDENLVKEYFMKVKSLNERSTRGDDKAVRL